MSLAIVYTRANVGVEAPQVTVETHLSNGLPGIAIVGLPETAVRESRERVRCAILNAGMEYPARRITVNLAPADLPKSGGRFDLAIALSILAASGQIPVDAVADCEILGELALTGALRPVGGTLPAALAARDCGRRLIIPAGNHDEACLVRDLDAFSADHLAAVCGSLAGRDHSGEAVRICRFRPPTAASRNERQELDDIRGQALARRALQIAAAGSHNLLLIGPPGTGKTLLANALYSLLPALPEAQALETAAVRSVAGLSMETLGWLEPPFRSPHHNATAVALTGGGRAASPGEVTLAHRGLLFLDELPEFSRHVLESLREPMESGVITVSRASYRMRFPARFQLVAAMNPCPCGHDGDPHGHCRCTPERIARYLERISGPLLDRIDMAVEVPRLSHEELLAPPPVRPPDSAAIRGMVSGCRDRQWERRGVLNSELQGEALQQHCRPDAGGQRLLKTVMERLNLSARACHRLMRVARTIADLEEAPRLREEHIAEAIACRNMQRFQS